MSFDLNILVNGNRCKQYQHQGKTFIEAKNGSEYVIEIKNNHYKRILAVGSVDGLNVLTGKTASDTDTGYIIGAYSSEKIKGFRFSDDEWAMFKFGYKFDGKTYAQSKEDGSEKNCGVIGLRMFYEKEPIVTTTIINNPTYIQPLQPWPSWTYNTWTLTGSSGGLSGGGTGLSAGNIPQTYTSNVNYTCNNAGTSEIYNISTACASAPLSVTKGSDNTTFKNCSQNLISSDVDDGQADLFNFCGPVEYEREQPKLDFDMGTEWGRKEYSKVHNVTFDRGCLAQSFDIYYASRDALINIGVPITNKLSTNLPQSFPSGYAQPPKNWNG
jgi:hypothetical protein